MTEDTRPGSLPASPGDPPESDASLSPSPGVPPGAPADDSGAGQPSDAPAPADDAGAGQPSDEAGADGEPAADGEPVPAGEAPAEPVPEGQAAEGQPSGAEAEAGRPSGGPSGGGRPTLIVRYGSMGTLGRFACPADRWRREQRVVIKSDRGMEIGTIVCAWSGGGGCCAVGSQIKGEVLRAVTHVDEIEERHLQETADREFEYCRQCIADRKMPMKLASVEHLFGGDRVIFYFVSESRVDFRDLVRDLAQEFQTRIEMRQIGVRDEARLLGDYEKCGRPLCCRAWIKSLEPVSMKMAKVQKATLDPAKISGRCGRLMCCLRFEHNTYRELSKNLPRKNTLVGTTEGRGKVVNTDVVTQLVGVLLDSGNRINVPVESLIAPEAAPATAPAAAPPADRGRGARDAGRDRGARDADRGRGAGDARRGARPSGPPAPPPPATADDEAEKPDVADVAEPAELADADDGAPESRCIPRPDAPPRPPRPQAGADGRKPAQPDGRPGQPPDGQPGQPPDGKPGQPADGKPGQPPDGKRGRRGRRGRRRSRRGGRGARPEGGPGGAQGQSPGGSPGQGQNPGGDPGQGQNPGGSTGQGPDPGAAP